MPARLCIAAIHCKHHNCIHDADDADDADADDEDANVSGTVVRSLFRQEVTRGF